MKCLGLELNQKAGDSAVFWGAKVCLVRMSNTAFAVSLVMEHNMDTSKARHRQ